MDHPVLPTNTLTDDDSKQRDLEKYEARREIKLWWGKVN